MRTILWFLLIAVAAPAQQQQRVPVKSKISIYDLKSKRVEVLYEADQHFEAPNWSPDGKYLLINGGGKLYWLPTSVRDPKPTQIDLREITGVNNDHGISPDGKRFAISARGPAGGSQIYVTQSDGSNRQLITPKQPSYFHGWSPDGKWLAYTARRDATNFDLYRISPEGGEEERLTSDPGYDDGPDYSPDGKWIYFNGERAEGWDIYRIPADGKAEPVRITSDELEDWFPHPSPDGKWMVFVSFPKGTKGHPANQNVQLRMMKLPDATGKPGKIEVLHKLFGGQGTINVNSWSPDSRRFAFVSYEILPNPVESK